jgi:hypothetical protein
MPPAVYREFCATLFQAAANDTLPDLDVRLQGSAAAIHSSFTSGWRPPGKTI